MNESAKLTIVKRERSSKGDMNKLRQEGFLPGSISIKGQDAVMFSVRRDEFRKALHANSIASVYILAIDEKTTYPAMIREIQYAPVTKDWLHVTFQFVSLTEETTAEIPFEIVGRDDVLYKGYELLQQLETLLVRGLPTDFPSSIVIEVGEMEPGNQVTVADLKLPEGITAETEEDRLILAVSYARVQEEEEAEEEAADEAAAEEAAPEAEAEE